MYLMKNKKFEFLKIKIFFSKTKMSILALFVVGSGFWVFQDFVSLASSQASITKTTATDFSQGAMSQTVVSGQGDVAKVTTGSFIYQNSVLNNSSLGNYWKMDNDWTDSKGGGSLVRSGSAPAFATGKIGTESGAFNGTNNYASYTLATTSQDQFSMEFWVNPSSLFLDGILMTVDNGAYTLVNGYRDGNIFKMSMRYRQNWDDGTSHGYTPNVDLDCNTWQHVVITINNNNNGFLYIKVYVNGIKKLDFADENYYGSYFKGPYLILGRGYYNNDFFGGKLDELAIYSGLLDEVTIQNNAKGNYEYSSGSWESPSNSNVIDLVWNGGWGDGQNVSSTAFSADVSNLNSNHTIEFQMKVADSISSLASANYVSLGTATINGTFQKTKAEMEALGFGVGNNRYAQVKTIMNSVESTPGPELNSFTLNYMKDSDGPETQPSSLVMEKTAGGNIINKDEWTNNLAPKFFWTVANDNQSGISGYCLYLGSDQNGNPANAKGLLGASGETPQYMEAGITCPFFVSTNSIDFATLSKRGSPWLVSSRNPYYFVVKAIDKQGNVSQETDFAFNFDNTPPLNPAYISLPSDFVSTKEVTMIWPANGIDIANDAHANSDIHPDGILGLQYRIGQGGVWQGDLHSGTQDVDDLLINDGNYTFTEADDFSNLYEGSNFIYFRTVDIAGNISNTNLTGTLKINTEAPSSVQNLNVSPDDSTENSYSFSWQPPTSFVGQSSNIRYCYSINVLPSAATCIFTAPGVAALLSDAYANQPGENILYVVAKDESNNINYEVYSSVEFSYSGSAPGIPLKLDVSDISIKDLAKWRLTPSWDEPTNKGAGVETYKIYRSDSGKSCATDFSSFSEVGSTEGLAFIDSELEQKEYAYCVRACDNANNCGALSTTVARTPNGKYTDSAKLFSGPAVGDISARKATISWTTERNSDSKVSFGEKSNDYLKEDSSKDEQTTEHEITLSNLSPGTEYYFRAKWTDEDGNTGTSEEKSLKTEPAPTVKDVQASNIGLTNAFIKFTTKDANKVKIYYGTSSSFGSVKEMATSSSKATYSLNLQNLNDETKYYYRINTFDSEGHEYDGTTLDFTTLPRPRISDVEVEQIKDSTQPGVHVVWNSNVEISSIISYSPANNKSDKRNDVQVDLISGQHEAVIMNLKPMLTYDIVVSGVDRSGNEAVSDAYSFTTASDTRPPVISNVNIEGINVGSGANRLSQLAVTWDTDEDANSQVEFGEGANTSYAQKTAQDSNFTKNHMVVISGLTPSKVYHLRIISQDMTGNIAQSVDTVNITPKAISSAYELVVGNLLDTFKFLNVIEN